MTDLISELIAFLFAQNKKEHPMPPAAQTRLWDKLKTAFERKEVT